MKLLAIEADSGKALWEMKTPILPITMAVDNCNLYFHDGTERPIPRPVDPEQQRFYYSGKKNDTGSKTTC